MLIHIGYHKTGSTWLQTQLFNNERARFYSPWTPLEVIENLIIANPLRFDAEAVRAQFAPEIENATNAGRVPVLSHEMLSGNPRRCLCKGRINADRLAASFPEARILIVIREQKSILLSWYKHHVRAGSRVPIGRFARGLDPATGFEPMFPLDYFEYDLLIRYYQSLFGVDRVLVLPFEMLRNQQETFVSRITVFAGASHPGDLSSAVVNPGFGALTVSIRRIANFFGNRDFTTPERSLFDRWSLNALYQFDRLAPRWIHRWHDSWLKSGVARAVGSHFTESNRRTSQLIGIDLSPFGYLC